VGCPILQLALWNRQPPRDCGAINQGITLFSFLRKLAQGERNMPMGTLDIMKLDGNPITYQIMFEQNAGGTYVARVDADELVPFMHEEMRVDLPMAEELARSAERDGRIRMPDVFLEENNMHAAMEYMEEED
jgi:hypothetical protein